MFCLIVATPTLSAIAQPVRAQAAQTCYQIRMQLWGRTGKGGLLGRYQHLGRERRRTQVALYQAQRRLAAYAKKRHIVLATAGASDEAEAAPPTDRRAVVLQSRVARLQRTLRYEDALRHKIDLDYARLVHALEEQNCNTKPGPAAARLLLKTAPGP